jgi:uncharacterized repeat protein (TIGR03806 family)
MKTRNWMMRLPYLPLALFLTVLSTIFLNSCDEDGLSPIANSIEMAPRLSDYAIFQGDPAALVPVTSYHLYELSTELFTDYAEKQRLIKIPDGSVLKSNGDGFPDFPDGTILVKTFFYYHDKRDPAKGKKIIETRVEVKSGENWSVGTYYWNDGQSDAQLIATGLNKTVNWIDENGNGRVISYHIPSGRECSTCHHAAGKIIPIGPKFRNLNTSVERNLETINQLEYFYNVGLLESEIDPESITTLPNWKDQSYSLEQRARAYLDVNCAHCHYSNGVAADTRLKLNFESSFNDTRIGSHKRSIVSRMENGTMPRLGTSVIHDEGLELIRAYINSL